MRTKIASFDSFPLLSKTDLAFRINLRQYVIMHCIHHVCRIYAKQQSKMAGVQGGVQDGVGRGDGQGIRDASDSEDSKEPTLSEHAMMMWRSGAARLLPLISLESLALYTVISHLPRIKADFFASSKAHRYIECGSGSRSLTAFEEAICARASSSAVSYDAFASLARSLLSFALAPMLGSLSDAIGRKPMIAISSFLSVLPILALLAYWEGIGVSFFAFYVCSALSGVIQPVVLMLAYVADVTSVRGRSSCFGLFFSIFFLHICILPKVGSNLGPSDAIRLASAAALATVAYAIFGLKESLPRRKQRKLSELKLSAFSSSSSLQSQEQRLDMNPITPLVSVLNKSKMHRYLLCSAFLFSTQRGGLQDVERQLFQLKLGFDSRDQATYLMISGAGGVLAQSFGLHYLLRFLGEKGSLVVGLSASAMESFAIGLANTKALAYAGSLFGSLATCSFAALAAIKSLAAKEIEQGAVQGALQGVKSLGYGVGPLLIGSLLFEKFTNGDWADNKPSWAIFVSGVIAFGAIACAAAMPWPPSIGAFSTEMPSEGDEEATKQRLLLQDDHDDERH